MATMGALLAACACHPRDPALEAPRETVSPGGDCESAAELVQRMQRMVEGVEKAAWEVVHEWDDGMTAMDEGIKLVGRFRREEGVRVKAAAMGRAHGLMFGAPWGPNRQQIIFVPGHAAVVLGVLSFEAGENSVAPPHLLLRGIKGERDHEAVDPRLLPGSGPVLWLFDEPLVAHQLAPQMMFGHEPALRRNGVADFAGRRCVVLQSSRAGKSAATAGPEGWYTAREVVKRFYVEEDSGLLAGLEYIVRTEQGESTLRSKVLRRDLFDGVALPSEVLVRHEEGSGVRTGRRRVLLDRERPP